VETLSEKEYQARAFPELAALVTALDDHPDELFAELAGDVLTIEFDDQSRYVINSHLAARQIWLAAERSAWHFDFVPERGQWLDRKTQAELWGKLEELLTLKRGRALSLKRSTAV
jgi:iron-sulfur cluster assembly protein CyaY